MAARRDPKKGTLLMQVNQQQPVHIAGQASSQTPVMKVKATNRNFIMHDPSQKFVKDTSRETPTPTNNLPSRGPYSKIRWVNSDATPQAGDASLHDFQEYQAPKRRRLEPKQSKKPLLTVKRPLKIAGAIHEDAWRLILTFSDPKLLLRMRYVSSMFRNILTENNIWRKARENHFADDLPDCPFFLTEPQYVDLLVGCGCQNSKCLRRETRKAYWIFGGRLCEDCLRQRTSTDPHEDDATPQSMYAELFHDRQSREQYGTSLIDLIPSALHEGGKYYSPRRTNVTAPRWHGQGLRTRQWLYLKSDYTKIAEEFADIRSQKWTPKEVLEWTKNKYEKAISCAKIAEDLMEWEASRLRSQNNTTSRVQSQQERADFFIRKAEGLPVRISRDTLPCFAAYEAALRTCNQPSDRAWDMLLPKLLPFREEAERIRDYKEMQFKCNLIPDGEEWPDDAQLFQRLHEHRFVGPKENGPVVEQTFVLDLARAELSRLQGRVADEDLVLLCLQNIHDRYQTLPERPIGRNYDGSIGPYKLSLDDARMIVEEVIKPEVDRKTLQSVKVLDSFRCSGCTRANVTRKWSFEDCFEHILRKHSISVGKDLHYSRYARNFVRPHIPGSHSYRPFRAFISLRFQFPWYLLEWTRTLPLLPAHAKITKQTRWVPDAKEPYIEKEKEEEFGVVSAFSHRRAVRQPDIEPEDFKGNLVRAAGLFSSTTLDGTIVTRIALQYSLDLLRSVGAPEPTIDQFLECLPAAQAANLNMSLKYKCGVCSNDPHVNKHLRFAKTPVDTFKLRPHWDSKHQKDSSDWTTELMSLPNDYQVMDNIIKQDELLQEMQMQSAARETVGLQKTVRKVPDQKASAIQEKDMACGVFDSLFQL